jgi:hypothetical protein
VSTCRRVIEEADAGTRTPEGLSNPLKLIYGGDTIQGP